ncbi:calponin homology domain-containing protein DDB_G0272472-like [Ctenopharyngodon idella]|uniref:calponin homology domain-containing protein DDB_G0272472-like n=1 Tax=Ctenopharyngodon idella TaxID=7959 RepID=UPI002232980A|nr:calponin homology domain-containing protein DDB_G0272472-like [Ctenopharyngodon idella]
MAETHKNEFQLVGPEKHRVHVSVGSEFTVRCHLSPKVSAVDMEIIWFKETNCVCLYKNKEVIEGRGYEGRVRLFNSKRGKISLLMREFREFDVGDYLCQVTCADKTEEITVGVRELQAERPAEFPGHQIDVARGALGITKIQMEKINRAWTKEERKKMKESILMAVQFQGMDFGQVVEVLLNDNDIRNKLQKQLEEEKQQQQKYVSGEVSTSVSPVTVPNPSGDDAQVLQLLKKIDKMVAGNNSSEIYLDFLQIEKIIEKEIKKFKERQQREIREKLERKIQEALHRFTDKIKSLEEKISQNAKRITELERKMKEERDEAKIKELERELEREKQKRQRTEENLREYTEKWEKERAEMEVRQQQKMEKIMMYLREILPQIINIVCNWKLSKTLSQSVEMQEMLDLTAPKRRRNSMDVPPVVSAESSIPNSPVLAPGSELRLVLMGRSGSETSAAGNMVLGREERIHSGTSTESQQIESRQGEVAGRKVTVVETSDWFCSGLSLDELRQDVELCVRLSAPGPHAFLLVIPVKESAGEEREILEKMEEIFGERCWRNTMVLITVTDEEQEKNIEKFVQSGHQEFQRLIEKCGNRFHCLNINQSGDDSQVSQLLEKIDKMMAGNTERFYSSDIYLLKSQIQEMEIKLRREKEESDTLHRRNEEMEREIQILIQNLAEFKPIQDSKCIIS